MGFSEKPSNNDLYNHNSVATNNSKATTYWDKWEIDPRFGTPSH